MKKVWEQTREDMNARFQHGGFAGAGGNAQSLTFARCAWDIILESSPLVDTLKPFIGWTAIENPDGTLLIAGSSLLIYDIGCAEGDGTAVLQSYFPLSEVIGIDISDAAVERAAARWPHITFQQGDILDPDFDEASIIFTSHTLEHLEHPAQVVENLRQLCTALVVVVPPIDESQRGEAHIGAVPTEDWLAQVEDPPIFRTVFSTLRPNLENEEEPVIMETSMLLIWRGAQ